MLVEEIFRDAGFRTAGVFRNGWVAWDGYRDTGRYRVAWDIQGAKGLHEIPKGRGITSVSVSPSGRLIAISVTTNLNIGSVRDAVYVLRTSDGREVFRFAVSKTVRIAPDTPSRCADSIVDSASSPLSAAPSGPS